ncbi:MAG TPA: NfeD family protein [Methanocorpusculum sp.]|nr:NfeD family protein [Methanocorpusculum sp.]HJJ40371.1 NfeD family protein [Methanocorpusculum sp.]HJJ49712.1 NfeD family protein [Methanocorpusculum sp.]HJJ57544.1 NfeD family protein [Methanocorpusculum sp.]
MIEVLLSPAVLPWILIGVGVVFLIIEAMSPGFFLGVPGTALVALGIFSFFAYDLLLTPVGIIVAVLAAIAAAVVSILIYRKISPERKPSTISKDTIIGKKGLMTVEATPDSLTGKVEIEGALWSAKSIGETIPAGTYVIVKESRGVHVIVEKEK